MAASREVAFELERFEWSDGRLEVAGRWQGLGGRRVAKPVLTVTAGPRRRRLVALPEEPDADAAKGWRAAFEWAADPGSITAAELEVGRNVVVDLPLPDKRRRRTKRTAGPGGAEADEGRAAQAGAAQAPGRGRAAAHGGGGARGGAPGGDGRGCGGGRGG